MADIITAPDGTHFAGDINPNDLSVWPVSKVSWGSLHGQYNIVDLTHGLPVQPGTGSIWTVDGSGVVQPISAAALPLPAGAATSANQASANTALTAIQASVAAGATAANQATEIADLAVIVTNTGAAAAAIGTQADAAWTIGNGTNIGLLKGIWTKLGAVVLAAGSAVIGKVGLQIAGADVSVTNAIPIMSSQAARTDRSGVTTAGQSKQLAAANASRRGLWVQNTSNIDFWISELGPAQAASPSILIPAGTSFSFPIDGVPTAAVNIFGAQAQTFSAREW